MNIPKTIILILFLSAIAVSATGQKPDKKEKIKSIIVLEEKHDMLVKKQFKESETYFDIRGNIIEEITYKQGKVKKHFKYEYDSDDNKIKEEKLDHSGRLLEYSEYKIENGLRVEKTVYDSNKKVKSRKIYQYTKF
jgi:hypothetical protein